MIYKWLFQKLPGKKFAKLLQLVMLLVGVLILLFTVFFPAVDSLYWSNPTLG